MVVYKGYCLIGSVEKVHIKKLRNLFKHWFLMDVDMGQQEVFTFLKKNRNKWFTSRQIADKLNVSYGSVCVSIMKLRQSGQVKFKNSKLRTKKQGRVGLFLYRHKWIRNEKMFDDRLLKILEEEVAKEKESKIRIKKRKKFELLFGLA